MAKKTIEVDQEVVALKNEIDRLVNEVKEVDYNLEELKAMQQQQEADLKARFDAKREKLEAAKALLLTEVKALFLRVPHKETKTQAKVSLPSGDVVIKKPTSKIEADKDILLEWAKCEGRSELISKKEVESFKWAEFKGQLEVTGSGIIDTHTGEVVEIDGLKVVDVAEEVQVKYQ